MTEVGLTEKPVSAYTPIVITMSCTSATNAATAIRHSNAIDRQITITTRKMISASTALDVIWPPQVGPTNWTAMLLCARWKALASALVTCCDTAEVSTPVCTVHWCSDGLELYCTLALLPPAALTTREIASWLVEAVGGKVKLDPPLNSSEKFSPRTSRAITLTSRMAPDMAYHVRWRPTKLIETSPRYSRPAMPPPAIMTPSR